MVRFIDIGRQMGVQSEDDPTNEYPRQFCFFNTVNDSIIEFDGYQLFDSWKDFEDAFYACNVSLPRTLEQFKGLCQPWVFEVKK